MVLQKEATCSSYQAFNKMCLILNNPIITKNLCIYYITGVVSDVVEISEDW